MEVANTNPPDAPQYTPKESDEFVTDDEGQGAARDEEDAYGHRLRSEPATPTPGEQGMLAPADDLAAMEDSADLHGGAEGGYLHDEVLANVSDSPIPPPEKVRTVNIKYFVSYCR